MILTNRCICHDNYYFDCPDTDLSGYSKSLIDYARSIVKIEKDIDLKNHISQMGKKVETTTMHEEWQKRVIKEKEDLDIKILDLHKFRCSDAYELLDKENRTLLACQLISMEGYTNRLGDRIKLFKTIHT
jgi:hypothetical protein